jgi:enamine deaminase RidA (YjgF/YER057c/UK114 family)
MTIVRYGSGARMSQAVAAAGLLFTAGQVAEGPTIEAQTQAILDQIDALLSKAGIDRTSLVSASVWLADLSDFAAFNTIWDAWVVPGCAPARATVGAPLAASVYRVEIAVVAALNP